MSIQIIRQNLNIYSMRIICILTLLLLVVSQGSRTPSIFNILAKEEEFVIRVEINRNDEVVFNYDYYLDYSEMQRQIVENVTLNVEGLNQNISLTATLFKIGDELTPIDSVSRNLTRYQKIRKLLDQQTSFGSYDPIDEIVPTKTQENQQNITQYQLHIAKDFNIMFIYAEIALNEKDKLPPNMNIRKISPNRYTAGIDVSQLHIPFRTYSKITENEYTVSLHIFPYNFMKFAAFYSIAHPHKMFEQAGALNEFWKMGFDEDSMDQLKEILFTNHVYLVVAFFLLSLTQTVLRFFTIRQEYTFWKDIQKNKGVSLKTLFYELVFSVILTLYVYQYNSSKLIIAFSILDILVTIWKISRTFALRFQNSFPYLILQTSEIYKQRQSIDSQAIWYLNYALVPLMVIYVWWSLYSKNYIIRSYYTFFLQTSVAFIAIFGFIMMTPQLYLNYRLKSVDHLNWRGLVYKFINTLLDDFFAVMVTMPMMRRLMYFRDDVIFIIYIYQRQIYKVDPTRRAAESDDSPQMEALKRE